MGLESFYGGRQGASFVIVKRFDGIDIPKNSILREKIVATNGLGGDDKIYYVDDLGKLVEVDGNNYKKYAWEKLKLQGQTIENIAWEPTSSQTGDPNPVVLDTEYALGMRQCFQEGGNTTNEVNYGEYVIIDTVAGLQEKNNPDNGKIYRRGMNFVYDKDKNPLAGAEYIGQIMGPQGDSPEINMTTVEEIALISGSYVRVYEVGEGMVPGKYIDPDTGTDAYNDVIDYAWVDVKDPYGDVKEAKIGFTFPYMILEFEGRKRSPYDEHGQLLPDSFEFIERIDDESHPYYEKWRVDIPKGIKGDTLKNIDIYPTRALEGVKIYSDTTLETEVGTTTGTEIILVDNYDPANGYIEIFNSNLESLGYINVMNGSKYHLRDLITNYDLTETGSSTYMDVGLFPYIEDAYIQTVDPTLPPADQIEGSGDQKLRIQYSMKDGVQNRVDIVGEPINYIIDSKYVTETSEPGASPKFYNKLCVYYSDPKRRSDIEETLYSPVLGKQVAGWVPYDLSDQVAYYLTLASFDTVQDFIDEFEIPDTDPKELYAPEQYMQTGDDPDYRYLGWGVRIESVEGKTNPQLFLYDYQHPNVRYGDTARWYDAGDFLNVDPEDANTIIDWYDNNLSVDGFIIDKATNRWVEGKVESNAHKNTSVVTRIAKKISETGSAADKYSYAEVGPELKYIGAQQNSNVSNLEEQLILGTDLTNTISEQIKTPAGGTPYFEKASAIEYKKNGSSDEYYTLQKTVKQELASTFNNNKLTINISPIVTEKTEILSYSENSNPHEKKESACYCSYTWLYNSTKYYTKKEIPEINDVIYSDIKATVASDFTVLSYDHSTDRITIRNTDTSPVEHLCNRSVNNVIIIDNISALV